MPVWFFPHDFPAAADPVAVGKEQRFKTEIYSLAQRGLAGGGAGFGGGSLLGSLFGGRLSTGSSGGGGMSTAAAQAMMQLATQGSANIINASLPAGSSFVATYPGF